MNKKEMLEKPFYLIARYWLGDLEGFIKIGDNEEEITKLFEEKYMSTPEHNFGVTEESYSLLKVSASEILDDEDEQSPYCEVCGHCGEIGCCGIRNFIEEHIKGKTNCKNEEFIVDDLISLCKYKDKVFEENKKLNGAIQTYDILLKANIEENEQLKAQIEEYQKALDETMSEKIDIENNWNKLKDFIVKEYYMHLPLEASTKSITILIDKMQELEGSDSNVKK